MNLSRSSNPSRQPLRGDTPSIGLGGFIFSKRIFKKYSFSKKAGRLPALVFLRLFGLRDIDRKNPVEKNTSVEWRINNYFEFHFYTGMITKSIKAHENQPQKQYNIVRFYRNILQSGMTGGLVDQRSSALQKFFWDFGGSAPSYLAVGRKELLPVFYTVTGSDKLTVKSTIKPTVPPARHVTGSYLQNIFNTVNTGSDSPATATKELLMRKNKNAEGVDIPRLQQSIRNHNRNIPEKYESIPEKYEKDERNVLFPVLVPTTNPAKTTLDSMTFASNGHSQKTSVRDESLKYNKTAPPSEIQGSNKESRFSDLILTKMKIPIYRRLLLERADTQSKRITREGRFVITVSNRNILTGLILNVQKMNGKKNERLYGRKQGTFLNNFVPAKPDLHFASNSGKAEKPVRIEDTIDTIVRKHTNLVLRKTSGDNIANSIKKQDAMKATNEDIRESTINKSISHEKKPGDINTIADTVYKLIERRLLIEKEKRGLV